MLLLMEMETLALPKSMNNGWAEDDQLRSVNPTRASIQVGAAVLSVTELHVMQPR